MSSRFALKQNCSRYAQSSAARFIATNTPWHRASSSRRTSEDVDKKTHETAENTRSGKDQDVAAVHDAAFNPRKTRPESEMRAAESEDGNPLAWSAANQELSKPRGDEKSSADRHAPANNDKKMQSGGGNKTK